MMKIMGGRKLSRTVALAAAFAAACVPVYAEEVKMADKKAYFAGGCFWCMEEPFEKTPGVKNVDSGYANSKMPNPDYAKVSMGITGSYEAVEVVYDPAVVSFEDLLNVFWTTIDPTQADGQFADRGSQYLTAVFYQDEEEKKIAEESKKILDESKLFKKPIATEVVAFKNWTRAEEYHQDYYKKSAGHYNLYSFGSGRKPFLEKMWKKQPYCPVRRITPEKLKSVQPK
jgi:methionine-S-sulfoxide reductase